MGFRFEQGGTINDESSFDDGLKCLICGEVIFRAALVVQRSKCPEEEDQVLVLCAECAEALKHGLN